MSNILRINHNIAALNGQRNLNVTSFSLGKALQRLSSGLRINVAADGPADLVISEGLRSQIGGIKAALRNSQEAANFINIAEGALNEISSLLASLRALSIHAKNTGVVTADQVAADQAELDNALSAIDRIGLVTRFGGDPVFGKSTVMFHIGEGGTVNDEVQFFLNSISTAMMNISGMSVNATSAISLIDSAINAVATIRGGLGAFVKNTLYTNINSLSVSLENVTATESYIRDANMAEETSEYTRTQILLQAGVSVLAQANVASQSVLQLLQ